MSRRTSKARLGLIVVAAVAIAAPALAQSLGPAVPEAVGLSSERLDRLGATIQEEVDAQHLAGAVILIARHGRVAYHQAIGYRDVESGSPMQLDTIFRIASQTKAITSVAAMILVEEGKLRLNDPVARFIPEFAETTVAVADDAGGYDIVESERPITIRDLLTHTAGISYGTGAARQAYQEAGVFMWYFADKDEPIGTTMARLGSLPLDAQPAEQFLYGFSTDVLGAVIEVASGLDLDTFFRTRILEPLAMSDTSFYLPSEQGDRLATVYSADSSQKIVRAGEEGMAAQGQYIDGPRQSFSGGAGLLSTAMDYARFLQMTLDGGVLDGARILGPKTIELMTADHVGDRFPLAGAGFGLGFQITEDIGMMGSHGSVGNYGWGGAYHTTYWVDPAEDMVAVFMTQLLPAWGPGLHEKFAALVYQAIVQ